MFNSKRGRPRSNLPKIDNGTAEFIQKKSLGITHEPLDYCLKSGIISDEQHAAGLRLRWLHTIRFGLVGIKSVFDNLIPDSRPSNFRDPEWKKQREIEYNNLLTSLNSAGVKDMLLDVCIFNKWPKCLVGYVLLHNFHGDPKLPENIENEIRKLRLGLDIITHGN